MEKEEITEADILKNQLLEPNDGVDLGPDDLKDTIEAMMRSIEVAPERIADIGAGTGRVSAELIKAYPSAKIDVFDHNPDYIQ